MKSFDRWLEIGADPEQIVDQDSKMSTFERLCCQLNASDYVLKCLDYKTDPNRVRLDVWRVCLIHF
jgi:hypothetical protein